MSHRFNSLSSIRGSHEKEKQEQEQRIAAAKIKAANDEKIRLELEFKEKETKRIAKEKRIAELKAAKVSDLLKAIEDKYPMLANCEEWVELKSKIK